MDKPTTVNEAIAAVKGKYIVAVDDLIVSRVVWSEGVPLSVSVSIFDGRPMEKAQADTLAQWLKKSTEHAGKRIQVVPL